MSPPRRRAYPRDTVVAEKFEAMVILGIANSRMKDDFDLSILSRHSAVDGRVLSNAIRATFARRETPLPAALPFALSDGFAQDAQKQTQWRAGHMLEPSRWIRPVMAGRSPEECTLVAPTS